MSVHHQGRGHAREAGNGTARDGRGTPGVCVILGRAGSKGVPGKNMRDIAGKPCAAWTIEAAKAAIQTGHVGLIAVSSDDPALLRLAYDMGCETINRPSGLATDTARVDDALRHAVETMDASGREDLAGVREAGDDLPIVMLYANVPVRPKGCIARVMERMWQTRADSVQTYQPVGKMHPWWMVRVDEDSGTVAPWDGEVLYHGVFRRQDLPRALVPDGAAAAVTRRALFGRVEGVAPGPHAFFGRDRRGVVNPEGSVVDIDAPIDVVVADALLRGVG